MVIKILKKHGWRWFKKGLFLNAISFAVTWLILKIFNIALFPINSFKQISFVVILFLLIQTVIEGYFVEKINEWVK